MQKNTLSFRIFCLLLLLIPVSSVMACTVFILTDGRHTYFFNNEDFTNPNTRLWFIPKGAGYYGCAYVGYNDGEPQGGFNTEGLAFDWVTVDTDSYTTDPAYVPAKQLKTMEGNRAQWMLEHCKTVKEAIQFYQTYREPAFAKTTLVIADKSGASVIIGSLNGKIYFDRSSKSRGAGYGEKTFNELYNTKGSIENSNGSQILKQCVAPGEGGTKYSNSYDLKTGEMTFYHFAGHEDKTTLNLFKELKKGGHYYEIPQIADQTIQPAKSLLLNLNRNILFNYKPLPNQEKEITEKIKNIFGESATGNLVHNDLSENLSLDLKKNETAVQATMKSLGTLISLQLIHKEPTNQLIDYSYIMKFENAIILWQFLFNAENKVNDFNTLSVYRIR